VIHETELEAAKSSHVYSVTAKMTTNLKAAERSYVNEFLRGLPKDYPIHLLNKAEVDKFIDWLMG
jgi:hypothetical protein